MKLLCLYLCLRVNLLTHPLQLNLRTPSFSIKDTTAMINLNDKIPLWDPEKKLCSSPTAALIFQVFNATSVFINIAHLIVLCNLQTLKGKPYWSVLVALCYVDIWLSVSSILAANCELRAILNTSANLSTLWNLIDSG
mgnify:CR=1 FL=1